MADSIRQSRYREARRKNGERELSFWLPADGWERLNRLLDAMDYAGKGKRQRGYTEIICRALTELENMIENEPRYGLVFLDDPGRPEESTQPGPE